MADAHRLTIRLPEELDAQLKALAKADGVSLQVQIVSMLQAAVDAGMTPVSAEVLNADHEPEAESPAE